MTLKDYIEFRDRARDSGVADHPALTRLLHLIQAKQKAKEHFEAYLHDMNEWEKNCIKDVKDAIREARETGMAEVDWSQVAVDTPILVKDSESEAAWKNRYFAKYVNGVVYTWMMGRTSWSADNDDDVFAWNIAKLAEEGDSE